MAPFTITKDRFITSDNIGLFIVPLMYLAYYIPERKYTDRVTGLIDVFKHNSNATTVKTWVDVSQELLTQMQFKVNYIVRALGHKETKATSGKSLDTLGVEIAKVAGAQYIPNALIKNGANNPLHTMKLQARINTIHGKYAWNPEIQVPDGSTFLILDDIATSGTTLEEIARAIRQAVKGAKVSAFTIARTKHEPGINNKFDLSRFK